MYPRPLLLHTLHRNRAVVATSKRENKHEHVCMMSVPTSAPSYPLQCSVCMWYPAPSFALVVCKLMIVKLQNAQKMFRISLKSTLLSWRAKPAKQTSRNLEQPPQDGEKSFILQKSPDTSSTQVPLRMSSFSAGACSD